MSENLLILSALNGNIEETISLLESGEDPNVENKIKLTPLMAACDQGSKDRENFTHSKVAKILIKAGAKIDVHSNIGLTPLMFAADDGSYEIVELLLNHDSNVNLTNNNKYCYINEGKLSGFSCKDWSALCHACFRGFIDIAKILLANKTDVNVGFPLFLACQEGHESVVKLLLENKANINDKKNGITPLYIACKKGHLPIVKILYEFDEHSSEMNVVSAAYESKNIDLVEYLLNKGTDINAYEDNGWFPLMLAVRKEDDTMVDYLIKHAAIVDLIYQDNEKKRTDSYYRSSFFPFEMTPLIYASYKGYTKIVEILLDNGACINHRDIYGYTSLFWAIKNGHSEIVNMLLNHPLIYKEYCDDNGRNMVDHAIFTGNKEIIDIMVKKEEIGVDEFDKICEKIDIIKFLDQYYYERRKLHKYDTGDFKLLAPPKDKKHMEIYNKCDKIWYNNDWEGYYNSKKYSVNRIKDYTFSNITDFLRNYKGFYKFHIVINDPGAGGFGNFTIDFYFIIMDGKIVTAKLIEGAHEWGPESCIEIELKNIEEIIDKIIYYIRWTGQTAIVDIDKYTYEYNITIYDNKEDLTKYFTFVDVVDDSDEDENLPPSDEEFYSYKKNA